jgi:hypothetical protein
MGRAVWAVVGLLMATEAGAYGRCTSETSTALDCIAMTSDLGAVAATDRPPLSWVEAVRANRLATVPDVAFATAEPTTLVNADRPDDPGAALLLALNQTSPTQSPARPIATVDPVAYNVMMKELLATNGLDATLRVRSVGRYGIEPAGHSEVSIKYLPAYKGGPKTVVQSALQVATQVAGAPNDSHCTTLSLLDYGGTGGTGQHVASYAQANRRTFAPGGPKDNPQIWASTFESNDMTGQRSSRTGAQITTEFDLAANDLDDGDERTVLVLWAKRWDKAGPDAEFRAAVTIVTDGWHNPASVHQASFKSVFQVWARYSQAVLDMRRATQDPGGNAIWMRANQTIGLDTAGRDGSAVARLSSDGAAMISSVPIVATGGTSGAQVVNFSQFAPNNAPIGFTRLPGGLLLQWGRASTDGSGAVNVTFPTGFATRAHSITMTPNAAGGQQAMTMNALPRGTNAFTASATDAGGRGVPVNFFWMAIGN